MAQYVWDSRDADNGHLKERVVRCCECKHFRTQSCRMEPYNAINGTENRFMDFCIYGEPYGKG